MFQITKLQSKWKRVSHKHLKPQKLLQSKATHKLQNQKLSFQKIILTLCKVKRAWNIFHFVIVRIAYAHIYSTIFVVLLLFFDVFQFKKGICAHLIETNYFKAVCLPLQNLILKQNQYFLFCRMNCECEKNKYSCPPLTDESISVRGSKINSRHKDALKENIFGTWILIVSLRGFSIKKINGIFKLNLNLCPKNYFLSWKKNYGGLKLSK